MEQTFPTRAIILERLSFREFDSKICLYSPEFGKMDLVVRGSKRSKSKLAGHIEPISIANFMIVRGKTFDYAGSAVCIDSFSHLKNNYDVLVEGGKALRMFKRLIEPGEVDPRMYNLLIKYLQAINQKDLPSNTGTLFYYIFIYKFISELGYQPELETCLECANNKTEQEYFFNFVRGGLLCSNCAKLEKKNLLISGETINFLKKAELMEYGEGEKLKLSEEKICELKIVLGMYVKYCLRVEI